MCILVILFVWKTFRVEGMNTLKYKYFVIRFSTWSLIKNWTSLHIAVTIFSIKGKTMFKN